jgi:hypothetical protein
MNGEIHVNRVLYKTGPKPGDRYRQIVVVELEQFQVRILEGEVIQPDPQFTAGSDDAEVSFHADLKSALAEADQEFRASVASGWLPYSRVTSPPLPPLPRADK